MRQAFWQKTAVLGLADIPLPAGPDFSTSKHSNVSGRMATHATFGQSSMGRCCLSPEGLTSRESGTRVLPRIRDPPLNCVGQPPLLGLLLVGCLLVAGCGNQWQDSPAKPAGTGLTKASLSNTLHGAWASTIILSQIRCTDSLFAPP